MILSLSMCSSSPISILDVLSRTPSRVQYYYHSTNNVVRRTMFLYGTEHNVVLLDNPVGLHRVFSTYEPKRAGVHIVVSCVGVQAREMYTSIIPLDSVLSNITEANGNATVLEPIKRRDALQSVINKHRQVSIVQKLQTRLYQVKDREHRDAIRSVILKYLAGVGSLESLRVVTYKPLYELITSKEADKLRKAVKFSLRPGNTAEDASREHKIDKFDIAYVIAKLGINK